MGDSMSDWTLALKSVLRLFATTIEGLEESTKLSTRRIVNFLVRVSNALYDEGAIRLSTHLGYRRECIDTW